MTSVLTPAQTNILVRAAASGSNPTTSGLLPDVRLLKRAGLLGINEEGRHYLTEAGRRYIAIQGPFADQEDGHSGG